MMRHLAFLSAVLCFFAMAVPCHAGGYCAFAYSTHTGKFGYSYGQNSRHQAERIALNGCGTEDAQIVGWAHNEYVALAVGRGYSWGCGVASTRWGAEHRALENCPSRDAHIVKWVYSFD